MGKVTITLDTAGENPSIIEEIFKLKVDKENLKKN